MRQQRESVLFVTENEPVKLRYVNLIEGSVKLYYDYKCTEKMYRENIDYTVDYKKGTIRPISKEINLYQNSPFYNKDPFNHNEYASFGNYDYMYHVDYDFEEQGNQTDDALAKRICESSPKLQPFTKPFRYVVFGDSISTGAEATDEKYSYFSLFKQAMEEKYGVEIEMINAAVGGNTSADGINRMENDLLSKKPALATIGFGMNDQNRERGAQRHFTEPKQFEANIRQMIVDLQKIGSKVILISPCIPNQRWNWASGDTELYTAVLKNLSLEYHLPFADVTSLWKMVLETGKSNESLLYNDINHPTDYGHRIYATVLNNLI